MLGLGVVTDQKVYASLHHVRSVGLARVDPGGKYDGLSDRDFFGSTSEIRHDEHVYVVARETFA